MVTRILIIVICATGALLVGCEKRSTLYCGKHPDDLANCARMDAPVDSPKRCSSNAECVPPFCELGAGICVQCLVDDNCPLGERCDQMSFICRGCVDHADCPSQACLPGGKCGDDTTVLFVDPSGDDGNPCSQNAKCRTITHALTLVTTARKYIKLSGNLSESVTVGEDVTILAEPGTTITGIQDVDWVFKIGGSQVRIFDLTIHCIDPTDQTGVKSESSSSTYLTNLTIYGCGREGGVISKGGYLSVNRSTIRNNPAGGIHTDASANYNITNNFIHHNGGGGGATHGGVWIDADQLRSEQKFDFNTVIDNVAAATLAGGARCRIAIRMDNSIIVRNESVLLSTNISGCETTGSLTNTAEVAAIHFRLPDAAVPDYHIEADSSAKDKAPVGSSTMEDFDGDLRPQEAGNDFGADEYRVPMP